MAAAAATAPDDVDVELVQANMRAYDNIDK